MAGTSRLLNSSWHMLTKCQYVKYRYMSSEVNKIVARRNEMFTEEKQRQMNSIGRIEKIEVRYLGLPEDLTLAMNRSISTPYHCAQHLSEMHCKMSALASVDGNITWDMHRPLQSSCTLQLLNFTVGDLYMVNKAFWRTCSFMLGAALQNCLKKEAQLQLHSFPGPNVKSGSFIYDIVLDEQEWKPTKTEMRAISSEMIKMSEQKINIERLEVANELAAEMFKDSQYKREQLPSISQQNQGRVVLYRMGTHIDISRGPMVASSHFLGKCTIVAAHKLDNLGKDSLYRIQGVALPRGYALNHVAYNTLEKRAEHFNPARLPSAPFVDAQTQMA